MKLFSNRNRDTAVDSLGSSRRGCDRVSDPGSRTSRRLVTLLAIGLATPIWAGIESQTQDMVEAADLGEAVFGACLVDLLTGETLVDIDADRPMIPASNLKLVTTAAALHVLGPDFMFRTELRLIESGVMADAANDGGNFNIAASSAGQLPSLMLVGDGDPAFGDPVLLERHDLHFEDLLRHWVDAVAATGVVHFETLVVDDRVFDAPGVHSGWPDDQLDRWYCAEVAGLNVHNNVLHVLPRPAAGEGQTALVRVFPESPSLRITNRISTGNRDSFVLTRRANTNDFEFFGTVRNAATQPWKVTFHDPPMVMAEMLKQQLTERGIRVDQIARLGSDELRPASTLIHRVQTALPLVLQRTNQESMNLYAEALLKRMGFAATGAPGTWDNGASAVRRFLTQRLGPWASVARIDDGSGLSRENRVTARLLTSLLEEMMLDARRGEIFLDSLSRARPDPVSGREAVGTLRGRFSELPQGAQVIGKSGYIQSVTTLSGYLIIPAEGSDLSDASSAAPRVYAFSLLINGYAGRAAPGEVKRLLDSLVETWHVHLTRSDRASESAPTTGN